MTTVQQISEHQLEQTIKSSLDHIVEDEGFMKHKKYVRAISTNGGNYLGDLFEVDIKGKSADGNRETNLFIKRIKLDSSNTFVKTKNLQEREIMAYRVLGRLYTKLMDDANIPESERLQLAKCYEANDGFLIFENLAIKGYETLDRTTPLSFNYAELAIKQLAKFHALSFVLQSNDPECFNTEFKLPLPLTFNNEYFAVMKDSFDIFCRYLDEDCKNRLRQSFNKITDTDMHYKESMRCLCHGDYRSNNLLVKKDDGKIVDLIPVDYQVVHYGNPMNDFWYLLAPHTDQEFRRQHLTTLKELYYDTLTQFLKYFDIDVSSVYPREEFEVDYENRRIYGLFATIVLLSFLFAREDAIPEFGDFDSLKSKVKLQDGAKERIRGVVDDYINWGII